MSYDLVLALALLAGALLAGLAFVDIRAPRCALCGRKGCGERCGK